MKPLNGVKVLDFTRVLAGPYCTMMLADLGAEVIKVERPGIGDDARHYGPPFIGREAIYFLSINRGKESISINMKDPMGIEIIKELVKKVDVVVENFRPGTMERLGIGYETLKEINPGLIYASCSGFGHYGPDSKKPGYDMVLQALGGIMSITSPRKDGPFTRVGVSVADIVAGMVTAFGITARLFRRQQDGLGDKIDVSMLDCQFSFLTPMIANYMNSGIVSRPVGNSHPQIVPFDTFQTKSGEVVLAAGNNVLFEKLCLALELPDLPSSSEFRTNPERLKNKEALHDILQGKISVFEQSQILDLLETAGVPAAKINTVVDVVEEPQIKARNMIQTISHPKLGDIYLQGIPLKFNSCDDRLGAPPPLLGEHTEVVLKKYLGYSDQKVEELLQNNVIESGR